LARFNHYKFEHWSMYLSQESVSYRGRTKADRVQLSKFVHQSTGMDEVLQLFDQWVFFEDAKLYFDYKAIKICPICFATNKNKLLAKWSFRNYVVCSKHSCLLVDSCTNCGELITEQCVHGLSCSKCQFPLEELKYKKAESDYFSNRINEFFSNELFEKKHELIEELSRHHDQIAAFSLLVYEEGSPVWKRKRSYSVEQKHKHQLTIGCLMVDDKKLLKALRTYLESKLEQGETNFGKAFLNLNKYLANDMCPQLIVAAKELLKSFTFNEQQTVGIIWLSKLYNIEKNQLKSFVQLNYSSLLFKGQAIPASYAAQVIDDYLN
jgi:hypothetical protein